MRRMLVALSLLFTLSLAAAGGEVDTPGKQAPPDPTPTPCATCSATTTPEPSESDDLTYELVLFLLGVVWR